MSEIIFGVSAWVAIAVVVFAQIAIGIWVRKLYGTRANLFTGLGMAVLGSFF